MHAENEICSASAWRFYAGRRRPRKRAEQDRDAAAEAHKIATEERGEEDGGRSEYRPENRLQKDCEREDAAIR
jgi:hypothetical protein